MPEARSAKTFEISFPYDPDLIARVKCIPGARWNAVDKRWRIPLIERPFIERWLYPPGHVNAPVSWFPGPTIPWKHQEDAVDYAYEKEAALFDVGMGAGKSLMTLGLIQARQHHNTLIVGPKPVLPVWIQQLERHAPDTFAVRVLDTGSVVRNLGKAQEVYNGPLPCIILVNYESVWREPFGSWALAVPWDLVVGEEIHRLQSPGSEQSRFMHRLGFRAKQKLGLSGTPFGQDPLNAYGVYRFLDPSIFGTNFNKFRAQYAEVDGSRGFPKVVGYKNQEEFRSKVDRIRFHVPRDVLSLPPVQHVDMPLTLPAECVSTYRRLERDFYAKVQGGEITAANVLVRALRLSQLTSGFAPKDADDGEGKGEILTLHNAKGQMLESMLLDLDPREPVVVFCRFLHDLKQIAHAVTSTGRTYYEMSGRFKELPEWTTDDEGGVLAVQIQTGAEGQNDMVKARYGVFYSLPYGLTTYEQACGRLHRPGQERSVTYYHLVMQNTIDVKVYEALQQRKEVLEELLGVPAEGAE